MGQMMARDNSLTPDARLDSFFLPHVHMARRAHLTANS